MYTPARAHVKATARISVQGGKLNLLCRGKHDVRAAGLGLDADGRRVLRDVAIAKLPEAVAAPRPDRPVGGHRETVVPPRRHIGHVRDARHDGRGRPRGVRPAPELALPVAAPRPHDAFGLDRERRVVPGADVEGAGQDESVFGDRPWRGDPRLDPGRRRLARSIDRSAGSAVRVAQPHRSASRNARNFRSVGASEPAPAYSVAWSVDSRAHRSAIAQTPLPSASTQPTGPA